MRSTLQEVRKENVTLKSSMIRKVLCFLGVGLRNVSFMSIVMIQKHIKFTQQERCLHYVRWNRQTWLKLSHCLTV